MAKQKDPSSKDVYEIELEGYLDAKWTAWFDDLTISHQDDESTTLTGVLPDQTALHSILAKIRDMNLALKSVQRIEKTGKETCQTCKRGNAQYGTSSSLRC